MIETNWQTLLADVRTCRNCSDLPIEPAPIIQFHPNAKILIVGQAPGRITQEKGRPFDDPSGERLRSWLGVSKEQFYTPELFAIVPMGFCYPGTGKGGDLPPKKACATLWRDQLMAALPNIKLTLLIGQYAQKWHLKGKCKKTLTETVQNWTNFWPGQIPLPHPSPRNTLWLKRNSWFEKEVIPELRDRISTQLSEET